MIRIALCAITLIAALATTAEVVAATVPTLTATVGPGFTISLKRGTRVVTSLRAGTYNVVVNDKSRVHNFHLRGTGVNKLTTVSEIVKRTWRVVLKKGTYRFWCDPHAARMKGSFKVT